MQIAIDGPASAGKSTIAKIIAAKLNYVYTDTGAMYRAATWLARQNKIDYSDADGIAKLIKQFPISFRVESDKQHVLVAGHDISEDIRQPQISKNVSQVAALASVRDLLVQQQRQIAQENDVVMDGRDIGTTVLPDAQVKIFLVASVQERAYRRYLENKTRGIETPLSTIEDEIAARDYKDSHRQISPLKKASDAIEVDTTKLEINQVVEEILKIIHNKTNN
ncbi:MAG: (d)CMP kinase [Lactobacillus sp.]|uniref:(d)CMP kinase n=1 Tax=Bombilactobacillus bombi TaxID=1303590 RepID=UPI0035E52472|nr:(d)CMP kinase [Lactobacillus sp.]